MSKRTKPTTDPPCTPDLGNQFNYQFPVVQGLMAERLFWAASVPIKLLRKLFTTDLTQLNAEDRAQRTINPRRVKQIKRYLLDNPGRWAFPAIAASIDGDVTFEPSQVHEDIGALIVPMDASFFILDGQHRIEALKAALVERPNQFQDDSIACLFFLDLGLKRRAQWFLDFNQFAQKPSASTIALYDHRATAATIARTIVKQIPLFRTYTDLETTTTKLNSPYLFTIKALKDATTMLIEGMEAAEGEQWALHFWRVVSQQMSDWQSVDCGDRTAQAVKTETISCTAVALVALGFVGKELKAVSNRDTILEKLQTLDWSRVNPSFVRVGIVTDAGKVVATRKAVWALYLYILHELWGDR